jgi:xanthine dehydrogenase YagR molybdenum-binding subunit
MSVIQETLQAVVKKAAELAPSSWLPGGKPDPLINRENQLIGTSISRVDGSQKVSGAARFAAEFFVENMGYAALAFSTIAKGRISALDTESAEAAPGVVLVMTHVNAPRMKSSPLFMSSPKAAGGDDLPIMQDDQIHWNGQPIALVLAESQEQADHAISLIRVEYQADEAITDYAIAKKTLTQGAFQGQPLLFESGHAEAALAASAYRVDETYTSPRQNHNAIELHAATVFWEGDELFVHDASQGVSHSAWTLSHIFGIDEKQVHVTSPFVGGGFGGKTVWQHQVLAVAASKLSGRPVRLTLSREGVYRIVGGRTNTEQRVAIGAQTSGHFESLIHTGITSKSPHNTMPEPFVLPVRSAYSTKNLLHDVKTADMDMLANTFMRAPGEAVGTFALESAVDELADQMGIDPIELRILNEPEKDPVEGTPFSSRHIIEAYRMGAKRFGWDQRHVRPGEHREGEWLIGMGCATATYPYHRMPGGAVRLTLAADGSVVVQAAAHEMGMGTATTHCIVTAERLGLSMDRVTFSYGDSDLPGLILAGGSQQTASIGAAVMAAEQALFAELLKLVTKESPLAGLKPEQVRGLNGGLASLDDPLSHENYVSILRRANKKELAVDASAPPPLETQHWSMHSYGAMFCEVGVNAITGEPRIRRFLGSFDCGRIINAKTAASQFRGGIVMGIGLALMEETMFDHRSGRIMNPSLAEYHLPVHMDVPDIDVMWTDIADPHAPMGAHGVGEIGITGVGAAVANAVYNATGKRVRELPIRLDKLL